MKLWIGVDGHVYDLFIDADMHAELGTVASEAKVQEGKLGFLLTNGEYIPVEYHSGEWVQAKKEVVQKFYDEQIVEWQYGGGVQMPCGYHKAFLSMLEKTVSG